jgi:hypothetical protein
LFLGIVDITAISASDTGSPAPCVHARLIHRSLVLAELHRPFHHHSFIPPIVMSSTPAPVVQVPAEVAAPAVTSGRVELTAEEDTEGAAMLAMYDDLAAAQEKKKKKVEEGEKVEEVVETNDTVASMLSVRIVVFPEA